MHQLTASQSIAIDGHADDGAWGEVAWSEGFQDIEGDLLKPRPRYETKVSLRPTAGLIGPHGRWHGDGT